MLFWHSYPCSEKHYLPLLLLNWLLVLLGVKLTLTTGGDSPHDLRALGGHKIPEAERSQQLQSPSPGGSMLGDCSCAPTADRTQLDPGTRRCTVGTQHLELWDSESQHLWGAVSTQWQQLLRLRVFLVVGLQALTRYSAQLWLGA